MNVWSQALVSSDQHAGGRGSTEQQASRKRFIGTGRGLEKGDGEMHETVQFYCSVQEWQGEGFQGESVEILKEGRLGQVSEKETDTAGQWRLR